MIYRSAFAGDAIVLQLRREKREAIWQYSTNGWLSVASGFE